MSTTIGVAIARRGASLVVAKSGRERAEILHAASVPRAAGVPASQSLTDLLQRLPPDLRKSPLRLALSPADLACADVMDRPEGVHDSALARLGPALCEARCAGESVEELSADVMPLGAALCAVAVRSSVLADLRRAAADQSMPLTLVTAVPAALAKSLPPEVNEVRWGGEHIEFKRADGEVRWRAFPVEGEVENGNGPIIIEGTEAPLEHAAALAAAVTDEDSVPNLLRGAADAPRSRLARYRAPLLGIGAAAMALFLALGWRFHADRAASMAEGKEAAKAGRELWKKYLPGQAPADGGLLSAMRRRLSEIGEIEGGEAGASALSFWAEIARHLPDPDAIGLTLETLDLSPDGGRLAARVETAPGDPLKNAALLEGRLNNSDRLTARGDYETRDQEVHVRLRIDYREDPKDGRP